MPDDLTPGPGMVHLDNGTSIVFAQPSETAGKVTDLMRVAQYVKSDRDAPSDVYNAACRMLDRPDEVERLRAELAEALASVDLWKDGVAAAGEVCGGQRERAEQAEAVIESVWQYAEELRTTTSPAGIAAVYADRLEELLPARAVKAHESNEDGRTPQTLGATEGQEAGEAPGAAQ